MIKDFYDDGRLLDGSNNANLTLAFGAGGDINVEDSLKEPCPGDTLPCRFIFPSLFGQSLLERIFQICACKPVANSKAKKKK